MEKVIRVVQSTVEPVNTNVLWLNPIDKTLQYYGNNGWEDASKSRDTEILKVVEALSTKIDSNTAKINEVSQSVVNLENNIKVEILNLNNSIDALKENISINYATKDEVDSRIENIIGTAPEALDTLGEIADRLSEDSDAINAINGVLAGKADKDSVYTKTETDNLIKQTEDKLGNAINGVASNFNANLNVINNKVNDEINRSNGKDAEHTAKINQLEAIVYPLEMTFKCNPTIVDASSTNVHTTINYSITRKGVAVTPTALNISQINSSLSLDLPLNASGSRDMSLPNVAQVNTFKLTATAEGLTTSATATVEAVYPMYFGFSTDTTITDTNIITTTFTKQALKAYPNGDYTLTNDATKYMWLCIGSNKNISSVKSSGFDVPMQAPITVGNYKCYRSSNTIVAGSATITIS